MLEFSEDHVSRWGGIPQGNLHYDNRLHIEVLVKAMNMGVYNIPVNWEGVDWRYGSGTRFALCGELSTYDFDKLTRLVIAAHELCVRVEIKPCNMRHMYICMWSRKMRSARMHHIHPTIESAVAEYRKSVK